MGEHTSFTLHAAEWDMLAEARALIDLVRAAFASAPREATICQHGHVTEWYEPDMRYVPTSLN